MPQTCGYSLLLAVRNNKLLYEQGLFPVGIEPKELFLDGYIPAMTYQEKALACQRVGLAFEEYSENKLFEASKLDSFFLRYIFQWLCSMDRLKMSFESSWHFYHSFSVYTTSLLDYQIYPIQVEEAWLAALYYRTYSMCLNAFEAVVLCCLYATQHVLLKSSFRHLLQNLRLHYCADYDIASADYVYGYISYVARTNSLTSKLGYEQLLTEYGGGTTKHDWSGLDLKSYTAADVKDHYCYKFEDHLFVKTETTSTLPVDVIRADVPLTVLASKLTIKDLYTVCDRHNIPYSSRHVK